MVRSRVLLVAVAALFVIGGTILLAGALAVAPVREAEVEEFIELQQSVLDKLRESFGRPHDYVEAMSIHDKGAAFAWPEANKQHLKTVLATAQYDGEERKKYLIVLRLKSAALPTEASGNSETMEATVLLNHYFQRLELQGLANSSPMAAVSSVQYAAGEWIPKERFTTPQTVDSRVWAEGEVFVSRKDGLAVIRVTVGGRFVPKGA